MSCGEDNYIQSPFGSESPNFNDNKKSLGLTDSDPEITEEDAEELLNVINSQNLSEHYLALNSDMTYQGIKFELNTLYDDYKKRYFYFNSLVESAEIYNTKDFKNLRFFRVQTGNSIPTLYNIHYVDSIKLLSEISKKEVNKTLNGTILGKRQVMYFKDGLLHRENGDPAVISLDGISMEHFVNGIKTSSVKYLIRLCMRSVDEFINIIIPPFSVLKFSFVSILGILLLAIPTDITNLIFSFENTPKMFQSIRCISILIGLLIMSRSNDKLLITSILLTAIILVQFKTIILQFTW